MSDVDLEAQNDLTADEEEGDEEESVDEDEDETEPTPAPSPGVPRARPRAAPRHVAVGVFGAVPVTARCWSMSRATMGGGWDRLKHGDGGTLHEEWPISDLSEETVRSRWGAGTYRVGWWTATPRGGRKFVCNGREVTFQAPPQPHHAGAPAASTSLTSFEEAVRVMGVIDQQSNQKLENLVTLVTRFQQPAPVAAPQPQGVTFEQLRELLREEREATKAAIAEAFGDDDDDENPVVEGARAIARPMFRGKAWWQQIGNYANENPEVVKSVAPVVLGAVQNVVAAVAAAVAKPVPAVVAAPPAPPIAPAPPAPPTPPPATVRERPRAVAVPIEVDDRNDPPAVDVKDNVVPLKPAAAQQQQQQTET